MYSGISAGQGVPGDRDQAMRHRELKPDGTAHREPEPDGTETRHDRNNALCAPFSESDEEEY